VNSTDLHHISHRFPVFTQYWSNYRFWQRVPLFNASVSRNLCEHRCKSSTAKSEILQTTLLLHTAWV